MPDKGVKEGVPYSFTLRRTFSTSSEVNRIAWSPDGRLLASATRSEGIQLWDTTTGSIQHTLKGILAPRNHEGDDRLVASLHDVRRRGPQISRVRPPSEFRSAGIFNFSVAWSPDGKMLASGSISSLFLWDVRKGELLSELRTPSKSNKSIAWSPDGRTLASGSDDGNIRLWDFESREVRSILHGHTSDVNSIAWSPDGWILASGSDDATVCLWNSETEQLIYTFAGHSDRINSIAWSPDGRTLASASSDNTIRVWDFEEKRLLNTFEGHTGPVVCVAFSRDGRLLASKSLDASVQLRRSDTGEIVATLEESSPRYGWYSGLSFHPDAPFLATLGEKDTIIRLWSLDLGSLLGDVSSARAVHYSNAKVVLVGDRSVGKTSLSLVLTGQPFVPPESTHGRQVRLFDRQEVDLGDGSKEIHETLLWDLAGQPNYRLIHQLHLDEVTLALVVFDAYSEISPFAGVNYWARVLKLAQHSEHNRFAVMKRFLVAARIDQRGRSIGHTGIEQLMHEMELDRYFETSARDGNGILELSETIKAAINWESLPKVSSTNLFQRIKEFIANLKERDLALDSSDNLYRVFLDSKFADQETEELRGQFETCVDLMGSQGLIKRLSFGGYVLLKPELLDYYASALINAVGEEPDGLGSILEDRVLEADFYIPSTNRLQEKELEKLLLVAMIKQLQDYDIALREYTNEGTYLIFPSQSTREFPEPTRLTKKEAVFYFEGPVLNIYATLAIRLSHSSFFKKKEIGKDTITFTFTNPLDKSKEVPGTYGFSLHNIGEGRGKLTLSSDEDVSNDRYSQFEQFVSDHLQSHALPGTIRQQRLLTCTGCGELFAESAIRLRQKLGYNKIRCSGCEAETPIPDPTTYQSQVSVMNSAANDQRKREVKITNRFGESQAKILKRQYDVLLCYNEEDESGVMKIRTELMYWGIAPWYIGEIKPGTSRMREMEKQIENIPKAAVFVGASGVDPWQQEEIYALLQEFVKQKRPVIPVFLEDAHSESKFPAFLRNFQKVDFRKPKREQNPDPALDRGVDQEKRLQEVQDEAERLLAEARDQGESLLTAARDQGKLLLVEARKQRERLLIEANDQGKLLLAEALNQGTLLLVEALEQGKLLGEVQKLGMRFQEVQELRERLQGDPLEQGELLQEARKLRERLLADAREQGEHLLAEALNQGEHLLAEARDREERLLAEAKESGERRLVEALNRKEHLLAEALNQGERLPAKARKQEERLQAEDQAFDQDRNPMGLLIWGITDERISV